MEVPSLNTVEGAYWYLMAVLLGIVALVGLYMLGVVAGLVPGPAEIY